MRASERAYSTLREDIVERRLLPGTVLAEVEQSERLGVSRTPLREALGRLSSEGLTQVAKGRGVVVSNIAVNEISDLFELRLILECRAAGIAAERGDSRVFYSLLAHFLSAPIMLQGKEPDQHEYYDLVARFDSAIDASVNNRYLGRAVNSLRIHVVRIRRLSADDPNRLIAASHEHADIAEAIAEKRPRLAEAATTLHLHRSLSHIRATHREEFDD